MKFEKYESIFVKENRQLKLLLAGISVGLLIIILILLTDKKYFVLRNSSLVETRPLLTWVCQEAFLSTSNGKPVTDLISESILNELKKSEFKVSVDQVVSVLEINKENCRIIVKSEGKMRSFLIKFISSKDFPFFYKLNEINEAEINLNELSKITEAK